MKKGDLIYYWPELDIGIFERLDVGDTLWGNWFSNNLLQNCSVNNVIRIGPSCLGVWDETSIR